MCERDSTTFVPVKQVIYFTYRKMVWSLNSVKLCILYGWIKGKLGFSRHKKKRLANKIICIVSELIMSSRKDVRKWAHPFSVVKYFERTMTMVIMVWVNGVIAVLLNESKLFLFVFYCIKLLLWSALSSIIQRMYSK